MFITQLEQKSLSKSSSPVTFSTHRVGQKSENVFREPGAYSLIELTSFVRAQKT